MWFYSVIFFLVFALAILGEYWNKQKLFFLINLIILIFIAAFRPAECCHDYIGYEDYYNVLSGLTLVDIEPTFLIIANFSKWIFDGPIGIFIIYSIIGVSLKGLGIYRLTKFYAISLVLYVGSYYQLHELTQIRVGVASAFLLLSIPSIVDKKLIHFLGFFFLGIMFHYSFMIFGFFYFLKSDRLNVKLYVSLLLTAFFAYLVHLNLSSLFEIIKLEVISQKINTYKSLLDQGINTDIKILNNPLIYLRVFLAIWFMVKADFLYSKNKYSIVLIKIYTFSIFFFIVLSDLPTLAGRISELLRIVEVVLVPFIIYLMNPKYAAIILSILFAMLIMYKQLFYSDLMYPYFNFN